MTTNDNPNAPLEPPVEAPATVTPDPGPDSLDANKPAPSAEDEASLSPADGDSEASVEVDVTKICSDMLGALTPVLNPMGLGVTLVLFDPSTASPLACSSTSSEPPQFFATLNMLLAGREAMELVADESNDAREDKDARGGDESPATPAAGENAVAVAVEGATTALVEEAKTAALSTATSSKPVIAFIGILLLIVVALLSSCTSLHLGARAPTTNTYRLSESNIALAAADDCKQAWVSGNATVDLISAKRVLKEMNIEVVTGNPKAAATSFADDPARRTGLMVVKPDFFEQTEAYQSEFFSHEVVHYCDLKRLGVDYELTWATSRGRWVMETRAYAQTFRTLAAQGVPKAELLERIDRRLEAMRNFYWLWDIDPEQYIAETKDIWLKAAGL